MKKYCLFCAKEVEMKGHITSCPKCGGQFHRVLPNVLECAGCGNKVIVTVAMTPTEMADNFLQAAEDADKKSPSK